jgi:V8-like Glu-specific endopeptidase
MCGVRIHSWLLWFLLLGSATLRSHNVAAAQAVADTRQLVPPSSSSAFPFSAVGQLANGCTGFLIGPCHVMTVAHCVVEPWRGIWWSGLDFYPGR